MGNAVGNVAVRFSVQDQEVVRKALESVGKDGDAALRKIDAAAKVPTPSLRLVSSVSQEAQSKIAEMSAGAGVAGRVLSSLGPVGIAVAAVVGAVSIAFWKGAEAAEAFGDKSKKLREAAESAGLTITQFKLLSSLGSKVGLDSDQTATFVERLTVSFDALRNGGGPLFDQLVKIDEQLVRDVGNARNTAEAIDILAGAYSRATDQAQRNALARAIGGRGGIPGGRLLQSVFDAGGLDQLEQKARDAGKAIDEGLVNRTALLKTNLDEIRKRTDNVWGSIFAEPVLKSLTTMAELWERVALAVKSISERNSGALEYFSSLFGGTRPQITVNARPPADVPLPRSRPADLGIDEGSERAKVELALLQRRAGLLGAAILPTEQLKIKTLELAAANLKGADGDTIRARALAAFNLAADQAKLSARERLGIASEEEIVAVRLRELQTDRAKKYVDGANEMATAEKLIRKEAQLSAEAIRVKMSDTPALTRLAIDANKLSLELDSNLAGALRGSTQDMWDMLKGTTTLSQGLTNLTEKLAGAVAQALLMKSIVGPLASALSGGLSGGLSGLSGLFGGSATGSGGAATFAGSAAGNAFLNGRLMPFASGGILTRPIIFPMANGAGLAGEAGPEAVMPLRRGADGRLGVAASGGGGVVNNFIIEDRVGVSVSKGKESGNRSGGSDMTIMIEQLSGALASDVTDGRGPLNAALEARGLGRKFT